ncbi:MAG: cardiolipin synthase [Dethiosulfovibrio peptidovorans]|nr:MAG: cardiolipin synthase [Dethiosulfovibrio peptidovorans]
MNLQELLSDYQFWLMVFWIHGISSWLIRLCMLAAVPLRHSAGAAMAWLIVIFFWPWPGVILYLAMGSRLLPQKRIQRHQELLKRTSAARGTCRNALCETTPELPPALHRISSLAQSLGHMTIVGGNDGRLIFDAETLSRDVTRDIDRARYTVDLLYYIFSDDNIGGPVMEALIRAARRGVNCRLLLDSVGSSQFIKLGRARWLRTQGIQVVEALPARLFRYHAARFDLRNHRKLAVVDGKIAYTGSHNMIDSHYGHNDLIWRDLSVRLEGPVARQLQAVFLEDWFVETQEEPNLDCLAAPTEYRGSVAVQTVPSGPNYKTENYQRLIVCALHDATNRVVITTPYLIPDESLLQALQVAALRGVTVQMIVPERSDQFFVGHAARSYYEELLNMGVEIHQFQHGLLHAKTMTVDGKLTFFGSSNFDIRSFALNFEINLVFYGEEETQSLLRAQEFFLSRSVQLTSQRWEGRRWIFRPLEGAARILSPLL